MNAVDPGLQNQSVQSRALAVTLVTVAVVTYRRPEGLRRLLGALAGQLRRDERPYALKVLVVDNDAVGSSRPIVDEARLGGQMRIDYVIEPELGIPFARNHALHAASPDTDVLAFVDDDEWPCEYWLDELLKVRANSGADCVWGPVAPDYEQPAARFFVRAGVFERLRLRDGARLPIAATNNVMFDWRFVIRHGIEFDVRMRFCGGSDLRFFMLNQRKGMKIAWSDRAIVHEVVPRHRMTWGWIVRRQYRIGNNFARCDTLDGGWFRYARCLVIGLALIATGVVIGPVGLVSSKWMMKSLFFILNGAGMIGEICGRGLDEYAPAHMAVSGPSAQRAI